MQHKSFYVKSPYFSLYEAFKIEVEKIGWVYNTKFNTFSKHNLVGRSCMWFGNEWSFEKRTAPMFALSNPGNDQTGFDLSTHFKEALAFAKELYEYLNTENQKIFIGNNEVQFLADAIKVGCTTVPHSVVLEIADIIKDAR